MLWEEDYNDFNVGFLPGEMEMRTIKTGLFVALLSLWVTVPALSANQGICRDGSDPILDVETLERLLRLARKAEASDQLSCNENNYLSHIGRDAKEKRLNLLKKTGKGCQLEWASFEGQTFRETSFMKANLYKANLVDSTFESFDFSYATLRRAKLQKATFIDGDFSSVDLQRAKLNGATFKNVFFSKADFTKAYLLGTDLREARSLKRANLKGAYYDQDTKFPAGFDPKKAGMTLCSSTPEC